MFTSKEALRKRIGPDGVDRLSYLQSLVNEFQETTSDEYKVQIEANLANFAYDPINYGYFRELNVLDIFLDCLTETNEKLVQFAMGGIANFINDPEVEKTILNSDGLNLIIACLKLTGNAEILIQTLTVLFFLSFGMEPESRHLVLSHLPPIKNTCDQRILNLCSLLEDELNKKMK